jgi:chorismate mutase
MEFLLQAGQQNGEQAGRLQPSGPDPVEVLRSRIDALDDAIIEAIIARTQVSRQLQAARVSSGGPRVVLSRERVIRSRYLDALGPAGAAVADAVLGVCRGTI